MALIYILAAFGAFIVGRFVIHEAIWRLTRDQNGYCGRHGHVNDNPRIKP